MHLKNVCGENKLYLQLILYDGHGRNFDNRTIHILRSNHIKPFILKAGDSGNDHPNDNGPNLKLKRALRTSQNELIDTARNPEVHKLPHACCNGGNM